MHYVLSKTLKMEHIDFMIDKIEKDWINFKQRKLIGQISLEQFKKDTILAAAAEMNNPLRKGVFTNNEIHALFLMYTTYFLKDYSKEDLYEFLDSRSSHFKKNDISINELLQEIMVATIQSRLNGSLALKLLSKTLKD